MKNHSEATISFDGDKKIIHFDDNAEKMFGLSMGEALQKPLDQLFPAHFKSKYETQLKLFARSGSRLPTDTWLEMVAIRQNGEEFSVEVDITKDQFKGTHIFRAIFKEVAGKY